MRVFETEHFKELVDEFGLRDHVDLTSARIRAQTTQLDVASLFDRHTGYMKDRAENKMRLLGQIVSVDDEHVFVWLNIFARSDPNYSNLRNLPKSTIERGFRIEDVRKWLSEQTTLDLLQAKAPDLPDEMYHWLWKLTTTLVAAHDSTEIFIFETEHWVRHILEVGRNDLSAFRRTVQQIVETCEQDSDYGYTDDVKVHFSGDDGSGGVVFKRIDVATILLVAPVRDGRSFNRDELPRVDEKEWRMSARRAYPAYISLDTDMWFEVQNEARANLALSPEEETLLGNVAGRDVEHQSLPLFINGSAGSGKSTMLAYIFAGLCRRKHGVTNDGIPLPGRPVFITYSDALVDEAKRTTERILRKNVLLQSMVDFDIDALFLSWRTFLVSMLPADERHRFAERSRINFHQFKLAYNGGHDRLRPFMAARRVSAEQAWYVIRSLIKGSAPVGSTELTPDDYAEMHRQDRVVSDDEFAEIYNGVYRAWYLPALQTHLWDDQDLVARVLNQPDGVLAGEEIVALVIDEAQDFTRRELQLIARACTFRRYSLRRGGPVHLPIVFAGDPMQSLSPTGFRWDAVKAALTEELEYVCENASKPEFKTLTNNYRSTSNIVGFANAIQVLRSKLYGVFESTLQRAWAPLADSVAARKFIFGGGGITSDGFVETARQTVIIVPCDEGGEVHFVQNDETLSRMFPQASDADPPGNVYSAVSAKGLEFERVILYKFGENAPSDWRKDLLPDERNHRAEYFFNKLYVGATRATKYLFVVDSPAGDDRLWSHLTFDAVKDLSRTLTLDERARFGLSPVHTNDMTASTEYAVMSGLEEALNDFAARDLVEENPLAIADQLREHGVETRNHLTLRQAKSFYRQLGYFDKASLCEAYALKFEGKREEAGDEFVAAGEFKEAFDAFWAAGVWSKLYDQQGMLLVRAGVTEPAISVIRFMAEFTSNEKAVSPAAMESVFSELAEVARTGELPRPSLEQWETIVESLRLGIGNQTLADVSSVSATAAEVFLALHRNGFPGCAAVAADLFMKSGQTATAVRLYEQNNLTIPRNHARRLAADIGYPAGLRYLAAADLHDDVRTIWTNAGSPVDAGWIDTVISSFVATGDVARHVEVLVLARRTVEASRVLLAEIPQNRRLEDSVSSVVDAFGGQLDVEHGVAFLNALSKLNLRSSMTRFNADFIKRVTAENVKMKWPALTENHRAAWLQLLNVTQNWRPDARIQVPDLVWGAAHELAKDFRSAQKVYQRLIDSQDKFIQQQARYRWLVCARELQESSTTQANQWRMDPRRLPTIPVLERSKPQGSSEGLGGETHGQWDQFSWMVTNETNLQVTVTDDEISMGVVSLIGFEVKGAMGAFEVETSDDAIATIILGDWKVAVDSTLNTISCTNPNGVTRDWVMQIGAPKSRVAKETSAAATTIQGVLVSEFKKQHGLKTSAFEQLCKIADVKVKGASLRLTVAEVKKLTEQLAKDQESRDSNRAERRSSRRGPGDSPRKPGK